MVPGPPWGRLTPFSPLPPNPGDKQPFLGGLCESLWLKQHLLLPHLLLSHLRQALLHTHLLTGLWAPMHCRHLDKGPLKSCPLVQERAVTRGAGVASGHYPGLAEGNDRGEALSLFPPLTSLLPIFH